MKFAISTVCCPDLPTADAASRAKEWGYDGIEIAVAQAQIAQAAASWKDVAVPVACLGSDTTWTGDRSADQRSAADVSALLQAARQIGAPCVRILDPAVGPRQNRSAIDASFANWLSPLADEAAKLGVSLLIENAQGHRLARQVWQIIEIRPHAALGACWDILHAALAGESPAISVPVLNSRIGHVQVRDAKLSPAVDLNVKLGEGELRVAELLNRLRGIGYDGWVSYECAPGAVQVNELAPAAVAKLKEWTTPPKPAKAPAAAAAKPAPAKPVAAPAAR